MKTYTNNQNVMAWFFLFPQLIGILLFSLIPVIGTLALSFFSWNLLGTPSLNGLTNYVNQLTSPEFLESMLHTVVYVAIYFPLNLILSLAFALLINNIRWKGFYRTLYFMPVVTSSVAVSLIWVWIYGGNFGLLNSVIRGVFHGKGIDWLTSPSWVIPSIAIMSVWWSLGYNMVLFMAGLKNIPTTYYEASEIDGASAYQRFLHITWPLLSPTTLFVAIVTVIGSFQVFDQVYVMTNGGPGTASEVVVDYIYNQGFQNFDMGDSSAASMLLFIVILVLTIVQFRMQKRWVHYDN